MAVDNERSGCPDSTELARYLDGELSTDARDAVEAHLLECNECRTVVADAGALAAEHPDDANRPS